MIRFVDLRGQGLQARFAFFDTVPDRFIEAGPYCEQIFKDWKDFEEAYLADCALTAEIAAHLARLRDRCPPWAFESATEAELGFPEDADHE